MKYSLVSNILLAGAALAQQGAWQQCGGIGWTGATTCVSGYTCVVGNPWYSQCLPGSVTTPVTTPSTKITATTMQTSTILDCGGDQTTTSSIVPPPKTTTSSVKTSPTPGQVQYAGINIAGFDFGCTTDGSCDLAKTVPPLASLGGPDGAGQMRHFANDDNLNIFRLPVAWQYLVNNNLGGTLDSGKLANYDQLVQACLSTGASCIIDIHNYARWNGQVIGQGGPSNSQFTSLWSQLASKYKSTTKVIFGIMNEPHDLDINTWAATVQATVTAIRSAGATSQIILLPGTIYTSAGAFVSDGSGAALLNIKNLDGSTTNLVFDVHQYLDSDFSGTHAECVTNNIDGAWAPIASWLRSNHRLALNSETGGGNTASCETYLCQQIAYLNANSDVYLGFVTWAAGSFDSTYVLTETPNGNTDTGLIHACVAR